MGIAFIDDKNQIRLTGADAKKVSQCAKEQGITPKQVVLEALALGSGYKNFKEMQKELKKKDKEFSKIIIKYELEGNGSFVSIPEILGDGPNHQLTAQMLELDEVN